MQTECGPGILPKGDNLDIEFVCREPEAIEIKHRAGGATWTDDEPFVAGGMVGDFGSRIPTWTGWNTAAQLKKLLAEILERGQKY